MRFTCEVEESSITRTMDGFVRGVATMVDASGQAATEEHQTVIDRAKAEFVPVDQGDLRDTGHVKPIVREGNLLVSRGGFGGPNVNYAIDQHENLAYAHRNGGQAKFYEQPMTEAQDGMDYRLAKRIRQLAGL